MYQRKKESLQEYAVSLIAKEEQSDISAVDTLQHLMNEDILNKRKIKSWIALQTVTILNESLHDVFQQISDGTETNAVQPDTNINIPLMIHFEICKSDHTITDFYHGLNLDANKPKHRDVAHGIQCFVQRNSDSFNTNTPTQDEARRDFSTMVASANISRYIFRHQWSSRDITFRGYPVSVFADTFCGKKRTARSSRKSTGKRKSAKRKRNQHSSDALASDVRALLRSVDDDDHQPENRNDSDEDRNSDVDLTNRESCRMYAEQTQYLEQMDHSTYGPLHEQAFARANLHDFHTAMQSLDFFTCSICCIRKPVDRRTVTSADSYLCPLCTKEKKRADKERAKQIANGESPREYVYRFSAANKMDPGQQPAWAQGLHPLEQQLVAVAVPTMSIYHVHGGQTKTKRSHINIKQDIVSFAKKLPRRISDVPFIFVQKDCGPERGVEIKKVRRAKVLNFLLKMKESGAMYYRDIEIDMEVINSLPEDGIPAGINNLCIADVNTDDIAAAIAELSSSSRSANRNESESVISENENENENEEEKQHIDGLSNSPQIEQSETVHIEMAIDLHDDDSDDDVLEGMPTNRAPDTSKHDADCECMHCLAEETMHNNDSNTVNNHNNHNNHNDSNNDTLPTDSINGDIHINRNRNTHTDLPCYAEEQEEYHCVIPGITSIGSGKEAVATLAAVNDHRAYINRSRDIQQWPEQQGVVDEFNFDYLLTACFPTLFPNGGLGDPKGRDRLKDVDFAAAVTRLLWYADTNADGSYRYRFAEHPTFMFWCYDMLHRHLGLAEVNWLLKKENNQYISIEQMQQYVLHDEAEALAKKIQRRTKRIPGCSSYWWSKQCDLRSIFNQLGAPTVFFTYSFADFHLWGLHRLLGTAGAEYSARSKAVLKNPHIVAWYFKQHVTNLVKYFHKKTLQEDWSVQRWEWQGRGTAHIHGALKLKNDPGLIELAAKVQKKFLAEQRLQIGPFDPQRLQQNVNISDNHNQQNSNINSDDAERKQSEQIPENVQQRLFADIDAGNAAAAKIAQYVDTLLTCWNPENVNEDDYKFDWPPVHPSSKDPLALKTGELDDDYCILFQCTMRHKCVGSYCLRRHKKSGKVECRFGFPLDRADATYIDFELDADGFPSGLKIKLKRNDPFSCSHAGMQLLFNRGNCDMQIVLDHYAVSQYIAKYIAKHETGSCDVRDILTDVMTTTSRVVSAEKENVTMHHLYRKLILKLIEQPDISQQQCAHMLLGQNLFDVSGIEYIRCPLDGSREVALGNDGTLRYSLLDAYGNRLAYFRDYHVDLTNYTLDEFVHRFKYTFSNKQHKLTPLSPDKNIVCTYWPFVSLRKDGSNVAEWAKYELIKHKVWHGTPESLWSDIQEIEGDHVEGRSILDVYNEYIQSDESNRLPDHIRYALRVIDHVAAEEEWDEIEDEIERDMLGDWEHVFARTGAMDAVSDLVQQGLVFNDDSFAWNAAYSKYSKEDIKRMETYVRDLRNANDPRHHRSFDIADPGSLEGVQRTVYEEFVNHFTSDSNEPLLRVVYGTAGAGKSYLIRCLKQAIGDAMLLSATTGVAAFNIGGRTIHSLNRLPINGRNKKPLKGAALERIQHHYEGIKYLVIDEMSMLSQVDLDWVNRRCKQAMDCDRPFGGLSVILVGDFKQLPPVNGRSLYLKPDNTDKNSVHLNGYILYRSFTPYMLTKVQRQKDNVFLDVLRRLPDGQITDADYILLNERSPARNPGWEDAFEDAIRLFPRNDQVFAYNMRKLCALNSPIAKISARHTGKNAWKDSSNDAMGLTNTVILAEGARVMLRMNLWAEAGLVNGAMGTVREIIYKENSDVGSLPLAVMVQFDEYTGPSFDDGVPNLVPIIPQRAEYTKRAIHKSRTQIPLCLAYAVTVHKSQGQTLSRAVIDVGEKAMNSCTGLAFVAISRVKTMDGLILLPHTMARYTTQITKSERIHIRQDEEKRLQRVFEELYSTDSH